MYRPYFRASIIVPCSLALLACGGGGGGGSSSPTSSNDTDGDSEIVEATQSLVPLNDTGITAGANFPEGGNSTCIGETIEQQDCAFGRDATNNDDSDGHAGFSFTKLDSNGAELSASAADWDCVKDNVTGLIWEVKTTDGGLRDEGWSYFNSTNVVGKDPLLNEDGGKCFASASSTDGIICHTEAYVDAINSANLCGASDWRMPTTNELMGILEFSGRTNVAIDTSYFPSISTTVVWSSSPYALDFDRAWVVSILVGGVYARERDYVGFGYPVRLVREG